ncbi:SMI1/KNR4 family protein [Nannocystis bainbridge]|uniref:SMI1/KNR4 family protein n=1 Tax=Nannocystis bainbridge TaxID=2995303 RepID=A0ABT5E6Z4_9BACT|nr:SMI1/KNR4 family protein [Nannocystis bainbridge]MDC0721634.1 SMI1/KNR4 family protein [Nannocystis bainbridge]
MSADPAEFTQFFLDLLDLCAVIPGARVPPGASDPELAALEAELEYPLPADLRTALSLCDGLEAPELAGPGSDAGLLSVAGIRERWRSLRELDGAADRRLLPIADDNGVLRYLVLIPGSKHFGAVATWDSDGDAWGVVRGKPVASLRALLEKALPKLQKKLPKGLPIIPGFARGAAPDPDTLAGIIAGLQASLKRHQPIDDRLQLFARDPALLTAILDALLRAGAPLLALAEHHPHVAQVAARLDAGLLLAALTRYEPVATPHEPRLLLDWSAHLDDITAALVARSAPRSRRAETPPRRSAPSASPRARRHASPEPGEGGRCTGRRRRAVAGHKRFRSNSRTQRFPPLDDMAPGALKWPSSCPRGPKGCSPESLRSRIK